VARASVLERLEVFLARHTGGDDLGLRLRGEQLAAGVRFVRMVREGTYDLVVGNPPYQHTAKMLDSAYVSKHYPNGKADLYAAFLERGLDLARTGSTSALLTMRNWMFIAQYAKMRTHLLHTHDLRALGDFAIGAFDEVPNDLLSVVVSVYRNAPPSGVPATAIQPTPPHDRSYDRDRTRRKRAAVLAAIGAFHFHLDSLLRGPNKMRPL
jgi:Eco57I restriction-modification methylase